MVSTKMHERVLESGRTFPLQSQLSLVFNKNDHLMTTSMARFYHEQGFILRNLSIAIEYEEDQPLKSFINTVTRSRIEATQKGDDSGAELFKLIANR